LVHLKKSDKKGDKKADAGGKRAARFAIAD
jgi:hypothetical protein